MGVGDCAANCFTSVVLMRLVLIICYAAFLCELIAFGTPVWFRFKYTSSVSSSVDPIQVKGGTGTQGLWNHCYNHNNYMCCGTVSEYMNNSGNTTPGWMNAVRTMLIISLCSSLLSIIAVQIAVSFRASKIGCVIALFLVIFTGLYVRSTAKVIYERERLRKKEKPAVFLAITVITYASGIQDEDWTTEVTYSFSFFMALFAGIGYVAASVLLCFGLCCLALGSAVDSLG